jgi:hypothetical protein
MEECALSSSQSSRRLGHWRLGIEANFVDFPSARLLHAG